MLAKYAKENLFARLCVFYFASFAFNAFLFFLTLN